jgi:hypothetical protein
VDRKSGLVRLVAGFAAAFAALPLLLSRPGPGSLVSLLAEGARARFEGPHHSFLANVLAQSVHDGLWGLVRWYPLFLGAAMLLTAGGLLARALAQSRVRNGLRDPLDALRRRPWIGRVASLLLPAWFLVRYARSTGDFLMHQEWLWRAHYSPWSVVVGSVLATLAIAVGLQRVGRAGVSALLAPMPPAPEPPARAKDSDDIVVSAVAVTARTRGAVAAVAAASLAMVAWLSSLSVATLAGDGRVLAAIVAYVAAAAAGAYALRRASRIAVGIDGVWVRDASRARFFSYRELEAAKASGADLDLVGGGRVLLRLQLHGDDAGRLDEVQARINGGIARATDPRTRGAELFVQAMPSRRVAEATGGPASYRVPSPSREQLWELVEASTTDAATRTAAAEALAGALAPSERARLRVVAAQCAEPRVRIAIGALAGEELAQAEGAVAASAGCARLP